jgi:hypothetical protein
LYENYQVLAAGEKAGPNALNINFDAKYLDDEDFVSSVNASTLTLQ